MSRYEDGEKITAFLTEDLKFPLTEDQKNKLASTDNHYYRFDLAEILRAYLGVKDVPETTVPAADFVSLCESVGAIPTAVYTVGTPLDDYKFASEETAKKYVESAFAVCGHEIAVSVSLEDGLFSEKTVASMPDIRSRIDLFYRMAIK